MTDEEIQEWLDTHGELPEELNDEAISYQRLFKALDNSARSELPPGFAHRVSARITAKETSSRPLLLVLTLASLSMILFGIIALAVIGGLPDLQLNQFPMQAVYLLLITVALSLLYHQLEKKARHAT